MPVREISNTLALLAVNISRLVHSVDFKPTDDAQLHMELCDNMHYICNTLETLAKELGALEERLWME